MANIEREKRSTKMPVAMKDGHRKINAGLRDEFRTFFVTECPDLAVFEDIQKLAAQVEI